MSSRAERDRRTIIKSKSPLVGHSLDNKNMRDQRAGEIRLFGQSNGKAVRADRRERLKEERKQALYDSAVRIFNGVMDEEDLLTILFHIDEFEQDAGMPNAAIVDFKGLKPTDSFFGEPGFFRKK